MLEVIRASDVFGPTLSSMTQLTVQFELIRAVTHAILVVVVQRVLDKLFVIDWSIGSLAGSVRLVRRFLATETTLFYNYNQCKWDY